MQIATIGLDLTKNVFQVHGVDREGRGIVMLQLRRGQMIEYSAMLTLPSAGSSVSSEQLFASKGSAIILKRDAFRHFFCVIRCVGGTVVPRCQVP